MTAARSALSAGRFDQAIERATDAAVEARPIGDQATEVAALNLVGRAQRNLARYDDALAAHDQAERLARAAGHRAGVAEALRGQGDVHERRKDHEKAIALYRDALAALRLPEDWREAAATLYQIGDIQVVAGHFDQALDSYGTA
ncbi:MAG: tetratricopeptide repeat protein, partial [Proteobacteria bacterium]|nr:tetratricopeptide repeat protein [Pseudomonadota bacterium]